MGGVRHTWTRDRASHPPLHSIVPGGALSLDGSTGLTPPSAGWLGPVRARSHLFRGTSKAQRTTAGLLAPVPPQVWQKDWVTHGEPAGTGTEVLTYLAPSIRRIALTKHRSEKLEDGPGTFRFRDRTSGAAQHLTRPAEACLRRFLPPVRPKGSLTVRSYGVLRPSRRPALAPLRTLLAACPPNDLAAESGPNRTRQETPPTPAADRHCRPCGGQRLLLLRLSPRQRGPP